MILYVGIPLHQMGSTNRHSINVTKTSHGSHGASNHCRDVIMGAIASEITSLTIVYSTVYSDADQRKYQSSASLAFVRGIHRGPVNSPHKWPVTRKMLPFDNVIMITGNSTLRLTARSGGYKKNLKNIFDLPFVRGIHRCSVVSPRMRQ